MALTTNYSWDKPTVLGDVGAWGTKLNTLFDAVDSQVKTNDTAGLAASAAALAAANVAKAENLAFPICPAMMFRQQGITPPLMLDSNTPHAFVTKADTTAVLGAFYIPIVGLAVGFRITGFTSFGHAAAALFATCKLVYYSKDGTQTVVSAGHSLPTVNGQTTTSGLAHDILADKAYAFRFDISGNVSSDLAVYWAQPVVTRP